MYTYLKTSTGTSSMKLRIICPTNAANQPEKCFDSQLSSFWVTWFRGENVLLHAVSAPAVQAAVKTESFRVPWPWVFRLFNPSYTHKKCRNCDLMLFCKTVETFLFLHMCNPALSKLIFNLLTGRVSAQNYFRRQLRSNLFISVHTHSILSTHSIPHLMPTILIHCAMTR